MAARLSWPCRVTAAVIAGVVAGLHDASGFGAREARVLEVTIEPSSLETARFVRSNTPIHLLHAAMLVTALGALLGVPFTTPRRKG